MAQEGSFYILKSRKGSVNNRRNDLILKLLTTYHLNVLERKELVPPSIHFEEILNIISIFLDKNRYFPPTASPWKEGESVYESVFIGKQSNEYMLFYQRALPINPTVLAESKETKYSSIKECVIEYLSCEFPEKNIDGISVDGY